MEKRSDHELLTDFATNASEAAFAALVDRHIGLVYSAAFRHLNDPHLAEDVTQAVFVLLARKAGSIPKRRILSGWLYRAARFIARDVVKSEARRRKREEEAAQNGSSEFSQESKWEQAAPQLDQALSQLSEVERAAVLLRYFEAKSLHEVGVELGCSEDAARKRVDRAVERLRRNFGGRNALTTNGIEQLLSAAPAKNHLLVGLCIRTTTAALVDGAAARIKVLSLVESALRSMFLTKLRHILAAAALPTVLILAVHSSGDPETPSGIDIIRWHVAQSGSASLRNGQRHEPAGTSCMSCHRPNRSEREPTIRHIYVSGTWQKQPGGLRGKFQLRLAESGHVLESIESASLGRILRGRNGEAAWSIDSGGFVHLLAPLQAEQFKWETDFLIWSAETDRFALTNKNAGHKVRMATFDRMKTYRIREDRREVETADYFDIESRFRVGSVWTPPESTECQTNIFQHYQSYDSIVFPSRILRRRSESEEIFAITNLVIAEAPIKIFKPPKTP